MEFTYSFSPEPVRCNFQEKKPVTLSYFSAEKDI